MLSTLRTRVVKTAFTCMAGVRADRWLGAVSGWTGLVLMMHRVRPASDNPFQPNSHLEITPDHLDSVLEKLSERRIPVLSLREATARVAAGDRERFAVLTIDDGYRDNLEHAYPVLKRHGAPVTVFVASGMVDGTANAWWITLEAVLHRATHLSGAPDGRDHVVRTPAEKALAFARLAAVLWRMDEPSRDRAIRRLASAHGVDIPAMLLGEMMTWEEVRRLAADPLVEIGGHTVTHPLLAQLTAAEVEAEIRGGLDRIEAETGARPTTFAYPYGRAPAIGPREIAIAARLDLVGAVTTERGTIRPGACEPFAWPRASLNGSLQTARDVDLILSGAPFLVDDLLRRLKTAFASGRHPRPALKAADPVA